MTTAAQNPWPQIGQLFLERGNLTSAQLERALEEQRSTGGRLGEILVERGYISRIDLAGALSTQWGWRDEVPPPIESHATPMPARQETVEPEPVAAAQELVPLPALPAADPVPTFPSAQPLQSPSVEAIGEPATPPVRTEPFAALVARVTGLEDQERLVRELQTRLRDTHEQLAAGEARLGSLEAILAQLSQAYAALNARLDAQTREIEDLRRVTTEQATRIATAGAALLA
jgi:hypothetical protein